MIADTAIGETAMMIHQKYALIAHTAMVYVVRLEDLAVATAFDHEFWPIGAIWALETCDARDCRLDKLLEVFALHRCACRLHTLHFV